MPYGIMLDEVDFSEAALVGHPAHTAALGRIFTTWSIIEASVATLLGLMMHQDHRAALALLSSFRNNSARINAVRKVGKAVLEPSVFDHFNEVMNDVLKFAEERNAIAHGVWGTRKGEPEIVYRISMDDFSSFFIETVSRVDRPVEETLTALECVKKLFRIFTLQDLENIEREGHDVLKRVMGETTKKAYLNVLNGRSQNTDAWKHYLGSVKPV